jgi:apolipoprotein N-acyltransferase
MDGLLLPAIGLMALAYSGLVLFALASALRRSMPPMRAALTAFSLSCAVHAATLLWIPADQRLFALGLWAVPHALILPLLLLAARRQAGARFF